MEKIIKAALNAAFPNSDVDALVQVVQATPNPTMATEMLLGCWEAPEILLFSKSTQKSNGEERKAISVDYWNDNVFFEYEQKEMETRYFPKGTTKQQIDAENLKGSVTKAEFGSDYEYFYIPTGKTVLRKSEESIANWIEGQFRKED